MPLYIMYDNILATIDVGTDSIKILVAEKREDFQDFEVLGFVQAPCSGVVKGAVVDVNEVAKSIKYAIGKLSKIYSEEIGSVYLNIGGKQISSTDAEGTIMVSMANKKILKKDVERVLSSSIPFAIKNEKEIIGVFPKEYMIDDIKTDNPENMRGKKLKAKTIILTVLTPNLEKLKRAVTQSGLRIAKIVPTFLANASVVLSESQKENGVALIDIGANNIDLSIFKNNKLIYFSVLPFGSANITNDIAVKLNCGTKTAERIKREIESLLDMEKTNKKKVELTQGKNEWEENLIFSPKDIYNNVILARLQEMLEQVDLEIGKAIKKELLPAGAVIVGGGAKLFDIVNIAKKKLRLGVEIGLPKSFSLINENPGAVTVCGLVLMKHKDKGQNSKFVTSVKTIEGNIKKSLRKTIERIKNLKE